MEYYIRGINNNPGFHPLPTHKILRGKDSFYEDFASILYSMRGNVEEVFKIASVHEKSGEDRRSDNRRSLSRYWLGLKERKMIRMAYENPFMPKVSNEEQVGKLVDIIIN